jgi:autotransporter-associated beta strand protein
LWTGAENTDFTNKANWDPDEFVNVDIGTFAGDAGTFNNHPVLNSSFFVKGLTFTSAGWTIGGNGTLQLLDGGLRANASASGTVTILPDLKLELMQNQTWNAGPTLSNSVALNVYGNLTGDGNLNIGSNAPINLYGDNTAWTGTLTVNNGGILGIGSASALGSGTLIISNGGKLTNPDAAPVTVTNAVRVDGGLTYNHEYTQQGYNKDSDNSEVLNNNTTILAGPIYVNTTNFGIEARSGTLVLAGGLIGSGQFGRGNYRNDGVVVLAGDNRGFSGTMYINSGQPNNANNVITGYTAFNHEYALGNISQVTLNGNYTHIDNTSGAAITLNSSANFTLTYTLTFRGSNDLDFGTGLMTLTRNGIQTNIYVNNKTLKFGSLDVQDPASTSIYSLNKYSAGNLIFTGSANLDNMLMRVWEGLFAVKGMTAIGSGTIIMYGGQYGGNGTVTGGFQWLGGSGTTSGLAAFGGDLIYNSGGAGATLNWGNGIFVNNQTLVLGHALSDGTVDIQNGINFNNGGTRYLQVNKGDGTAKIDARFSGSITGGVVGSNLWKIGDGVLELAGNNNYVGWTTVGAGTLLISGTTSGQQRSYTVNSGATLGGHGVIGASGNECNVNVLGILDISGGGVLDDIGTLTLNLGPGALDLTNAESLGFILGADGVSDQIKLGAGTKLTLGADFDLGLFDFTFGSGFTGQGTYELIVGEAGFLSSFSELTGNYGDYDLALSLLGNTLTLTVIPEPSTWLLLTVGATLLVTTLRRRC